MSFKPWNTPTFADKSTTGALQVIANSKVDIQEFDDNKPEQLWVKGDEDNDGYITFESSEPQKFLTAEGKQLEIQGTYFLVQTISK